MNGDIKVELKGVNHPFAYYVEKPTKVDSSKLDQSEPSEDLSDNF